MAEVAYVAEITGDRPPFRWKINRKQAQTSAYTLSNYGGEADTFEEAAFAAQQAAHEAHAEWTYERTKTQITVLLTDDAVTTPEGLDIPVTEKGESPIPDWLPTNMTKEQLKKFT